MIQKLKIVFFCLVVLSSFSGMAIQLVENQTTLNCQELDQVNLSAVQVIGHKKTNSKVILNEFGIKAPTIVCLTQIEEGVRRLERTGLFSQVQTNLISEETGESKNLELQVIEKWTTIPILKFNSGGGVSQFTLGVYDPNLFGEYLESGFQYESLGGAGSGVFWFKNPRLLGQRQGIDFQYWNTKRIRIKYDQKADSPEITQAFLLTREKVFLEYFRELQPQLKVFFSVESNQDQFSTDLLPSSVLDEVGLNQTLPISTDFLIPRIGFEYGQINGQPQLLRGSVLGISVSQAQSLSSLADHFFQADLSYQSYKSITPNLQFAQRLLAGATSTKVLQYWYYLGGLDRVRGFSDNRFAGRQFILSNSEMRYLIIEKPSYLIQVVGFVDIGAIGENAEDLKNIKAASAGAGLRLILPQFYRFVVRVDYAQPVLKTDDLNLSFGVQQFF